MDATRKQSWPFSDSDNNDQEQKQRSPCDEDAEKGVICSLLLEPASLPGLKINPNAFFVRAHQILYDAICEWDKPGQRVDFVWLKDWLTKQGQLDEAGGKEGITALFAVIPMATDISHYVEIITEKHALRQTIDICQRALNRCRDRDANPATILTETNQHLVKVVHGRNGDDRMEAFAKATIKGSNLLSVKIPPRQIVIKDWYKEGDLGFVYAYRGSGKTWFVLALANALANGSECGPWEVQGEWPVLYVDGEMAYSDNISRIKGLNEGTIPPNLSVLNHELLYHSSELVMNFASAADQQIILKVCLAKNIRVLILDNLGCLFSGVAEDKADEWEKVLPWLLTLRRHMISVIVVHHTGHDPTRMRGTIKREDSANWVLRLDDKREDFSEPGAKFISRFRKYRGRDTLFDYEWTFTPAGDRTIITIEQASRADIVLQWVRDGLTSCSDIAKEIGVSTGTVSKIATRLIKEGKLEKTKTRGYRVLE